MSPIEKDIAQAQMATTIVCIIQNY